MRRLILPTALLFLIVPMTRSAPQKLPESPTPLITVSAATTDKLPQLDSQTVQRFHPNAFVLTNLSNRDVVGLVVRWTYVDSNQQPRTFVMNSDSFMQPRSPAIITAGTRMLVAPGIFLPEAMATTPHIGPPLEKMDGSSRPELQDASQIAAKIDTLLWSDGEVVGPNESQYDAQVENRKMAAGALAKQLRNAIAKGQDPKAILLNVLASEPAREDSLGRWRVKYAKLLANARNFDQLLTSLENLPEPPKFFHK